MTDPFAEAREQAEGDHLLRAAEYELLGLKPDEELRINRLGKRWHSRDVMRDSLSVAHGRGDDCAERHELFSIADREFRQALAQLHPDDEQCTDDEQETQQ